MSEKRGVAFQQSFELGEMAMMRKYTVFCAVAVLFNIHQCIGRKYVSYTQKMCR
jgi:hypothetical protein